MPRPASKARTQIRQTRTAAPSSMTYPAASGQLRIRADDTTGLHREECDRDKQAPRRWRCSGFNDPPESMSRERWMALLFAIRSACFLIGPFPGYAQLVGASADADHFFVGSILFTGRGALQTSDRVPRAQFRRRRESGILGGRDPIRRHPVLQRDDLPGAAHIPVQSQLQQARVATGRVGLDLLPGLGRDRLPRLGAARLAPRARSAGLVGTGGQPARLHLLRDLRDRRLPRSFDGLRH